MDLLRPVGPACLLSRVLSPSLSRIYCNLCNRINQIRKTIFQLGEGVDGDGVAWGAGPMASARSVMPMTNPIRRKKLQMARAIVRASLVCVLVRGFFGVYIHGTWFCFLSDSAWSDQPVSFRNRPINSDLCISSHVYIHSMSYIHAYIQVFKLPYIMNRENNLCRVSIDA